MKRKIMRMQYNTPVLFIINAIVKLPVMKVIIVSLRFQYGHHQNFRRNKGYPINPSSSNLIKNGINAAINCSPVLNNYNLTISLP